RCGLDRGDEDIAKRIDSHAGRTVDVCRCRRLTVKRVVAGRAVAGEGGDYSVKAHLPYSRVAFVCDVKIPARVERDLRGAEELGGRGELTITGKPVCAERAGEGRDCAAGVVNAPHRVVRE